MNTVSTVLTMDDRLGAWKVRWGINRMGYTVEPGIYAVNNPSADAEVFVSANYKLSFDILRSQLEGLDAWILVLDTKGINVWCAAGKGTFGTRELIKRIESTGLSNIVSHRNLIVPQLGAVGVSAYEVQKQSGFRVVYGPVRASDIKAFIDAGMKATEDMRQVRFTFYDRLVLTPVEFVNNLKYLLLTVIFFFILSGLHSKGFSSQLMLHDGVISAAIILSAYVCGSVLGPVLLPWISGRSFALKGAFLGFALTAVLWSVGLTGHSSQPIFWLLLIMSITSFLVMMFTGSSTYTSLSGVRKEMRIAVPLQLVSASAGLVLWLSADLYEMENTMTGQTYLKNVVTLKLIVEKCIGCGLCVTVCPHRVFRMNQKKAYITDRDACMECGACSRNCPTAAIDVKSGVGCASAVINGFLGKTDAECSCCCDKNSCC